MILYFDNYITGEAINAATPVWSDEARRGVAEIYKLPSKFDVSLYTLASYSVIDWSAVVVKYELQDKSRNEEFERKVREIYPKAIIIQGRSDNQAKFQESVKLLRKLGDEWIFYAGNNDHPCVASELGTLKHCLDKAKEYKKKYRFVSIYSQNFEALQAWNPSSLRYDKSWEKLEEDDSCIIAVAKEGFFDAIQIVHIDLFEHWFCSKDLSGTKARIFRTDPLETLVPVKDQLVVIPKKEFCAHFDGHSHLLLHGYDNPIQYHPPLLIPPGFFEGKIKIAYGYDGYREGWVNINPLKKKYSFQQKGGTDLKLTLEELPLFWKSRIAEIDSNPSADLDALKKAYEEDLYRKNVAYWKSTPLSRAKKRVMKVVWVASTGVPRWANRVKAWCSQPEALQKVLDEQDKGAEGKAKQAAKRVIYKAIITAHKVGILRKKKN